MTDRELMQEALDALEVAPYMSNKDDYDFHQKSINALRARLSQPEPTNRFNPDWDALPVMVEEQQRMAKRIEELETQLGEAMWGYGEWRRKAEALEQEKQEPVCVAFIRTYVGKDKDGIEIWKDEPVYTAPPQREWVGLTREELEEISEFHFHGAFSGRDVYEDIETRLKEKNT